MKPIFKTWAVLTITAVAALGLYNCQDPEESADVNQDRIYTIYELVYNGNKDMTYARATFRFGNNQGTLLKLTSPSGVSFNGDPLTLTTEPVTNYTLYQKEYAGYVDQGTFEWTDYDGNTFTNDIEIHVINYPDTIADIDRTASYELTWKGNALAQDENVTLILNNVDTVAFDAQTFVQNDVGSTGIILSKNKLERLPAGNGEFLMERKYKPDLTEATGAGGIISGIYRPENVTVTIK